MGLLGVCACIKMSFTNRIALHFEQNVTPRRIWYHHCCGNHFWRYCLGRLGCCVHRGWVANNGESVDKEAHRVAHLHVAAFWNDQHTGFSTGSTWMSCMNQCSWFLRMLPNKKLDGTHEPNSKYFSLTIGDTCIHATSLHHCSTSLQHTIPNTSVTTAPVQHPYNTSSQNLYNVSWQHLSTIPFSTRLYNISHQHFSQHSSKTSLYTVNASTHFSTFIQCSSAIYIPHVWQIFPTFSYKTFLQHLCTQKSSQHLSTTLLYNTLPNTLPNTSCNALPQQSYKHFCALHNTFLNLFVWHFPFPSKVFTTLLYNTSVRHFFKPPMTLV